MKYTIYKNDHEIKTVDNKFQLYKAWNDLQQTLMIQDNFDCCAGFHFMQDRERNIYDVKNFKNEVPKYDSDEFKKMKKKNEKI